MSDKLLPPEKRASDDWLLFINLRRSVRAKRRQVFAGEASLINITIQYKKLYLLPCRLFLLNRFVYNAQEAFLFSYYWDSRHCRCRRILIVAVKMHPLTSARTHTHTLMGKLRRQIADDKLIVVRRRDHQEGQRLLGCAAKRRWLSNER